MLSSSLFRYLRLILVLAFAAVVWLAAAPLDSSAPEPQPTVPSGDQLVDDLALGKWLTDSWNARITAYPSNRPTTTDFELFPRTPTSRRLRPSAVPFGMAIHEAATRYRLDGPLLAAIVEAESNFDAHSVSPAGALGLMQVMPDIAGEHGGDPFDPAVNLDVGAKYFSSLLTRFSGDVELALAAYNAGPTTVLRYGRVPPYRETQAFVRKVMTIYEDRSRDGEPELRLAQALPAPDVLRSRR